VTTYARKPPTHKHIYIYIYIYIYAINYVLKINNLMMLESISCRTEVSGGER